MPQFDQVREDGIRGSRAQSRWKRAVDARDDLIDRRVAGAQGIEDSPVSIGAMLHVLVDEGGRIGHDRSVPGKQPWRTQCTNPFERLEICNEVAALARGNHDGAAMPDQITAVNIGAVLLPKAAVIR